MKNMNQMMKQAKKMQEQMGKVQEDLKAKTIETTVGGGMVTVVANGERKINSISINREVVDPEDVEMLQDLVLSAINDALNQVDKMIEQDMGKVTGGLNIPGLF